MMRVFLLGIPIDAVTQEETVTRILGFLGVSVQHHIMTPNSEMLVEASGNPEFRNVLCRSALNLPDSIGLLWMARWTGQDLPERVTGVDTVRQLCLRLTEEHPVFFLGGRKGVARKAVEELQHINSHLRVAGTYEGGPDESDAAEILRRITDARPHLLLVAFGAPAQDLWIAKYLRELPTVRVAVGVGGGFDFLAGEKRRAPLFLQNLGLEWFWRLLLEPQRIRRIWRAVAVFPWLVMRYGKASLS